MTILSIIIIIIKELLSVGIVQRKAGVENGGSLGHRRIALKMGLRICSRNFRNTLLCLSSPRTQTLLHNNI